MSKIYGIVFPGMIIPAIAILFGNICSTPNAYASRQIFSLGPTGLALTDHMLLVATRLNNISDDNAFEVEVKSILLESAGRIRPASLPILLGEIDAAHSAVVQASFTSDGLKQGEQYQLRVKGVYTLKKNGKHDNDHEFGNKTENDNFSKRHDDDENKHEDDKDHEFTVSTEINLPPPAPGNANLQTGSVISQMATGGGFPHVNLPDNFDEANDMSPPVPTGPFIAVTPTPNGTMPMPDPGDPSVAFNANDPLNLVSGCCNGQASTTAE